jgi:hypothetical protein
MAKIEKEVEEAIAQKKMWYRDGDSEPEPMKVD